MPRIVINRVHRVSVTLDNSSSTEALVSASWSHGDSKLSKQMMQSFEFNIVDIRDHIASVAPLKTPSVFASSIKRAPDEKTDSQATKYLASAKSSWTRSWVSTAFATVLLP